MLGIVKNFTVFVFKTVNVFSRSADIFLLVHQNCRFLQVNEILLHKKSIFSHIKISNVPIMWPLPALMLHKHLFLPNLYNAENRLSERQVAIDLPESLVL